MTQQSFTEALKNWKADLATVTTFSELLVPLQTLQSFSKTLPQEEEKATVEKIKEIIIPFVDGHVLSHNERARSMGWSCYGRRLLPQVIQIHIFQFVGLASSLVSAAITCKEFHKTISNPRTNCFYPPPTIRFDSMFSRAMEPPTEISMFWRNGEKKNDLVLEDASNARGAEYDVLQSLIASLRVEQTKDTDRVTTSKIPSIVQWMYGTVTTTIDSLTWFGVPGVAELFANSRHVSMSFCHNVGFPVQRYLVNSPYRIQSMEIPCPVLRLLSPTMFPKLKAIQLEVTPNGGLISLNDYPFDLWGVRLVKEIRCAFDSMPNDAVMMKDLNQNLSRFTHVKSFNCELSFKNNKYYLHAPPGIEKIRFDGGALMNIGLSNAISTLKEVTVSMTGWQDGFNEQTERWISMGLIPAADRGENEVVYEFSRICSMFMQLTSLERVEIMWCGHSFDFLEMFITQTKALFKSNERNCQKKDGCALRHVNFQVNRYGDMDAESETEDDEMWEEVKSLVSDFLRGLPLFEDAELCVEQTM